MRKIFLILCMFLSMQVFSQQFVEEVDGFDWISWSMDERGTYLIGFYSAYSSLMIRIGDEAQMTGQEMTDEYIEWVNEYFFFDIDIAEMMNRVNDFYSSYSNRRYRLYEVVLLSGGKDYWN